MVQRVVARGEAGGVGGGQCAIVLQGDGPGGGEAAVNVRVVLGGWRHPQGTAVRLGGRGGGGVERGGGCLQHEHYLAR